MMEEVLSEMYASEAVAEVTRTPADVALDTAIRTAVKKRIEDLDHSFLVALDEYITQASRSNNNTAGMLALIREEVVSQVGERLPTGLRILNHVMGLDTQKERLSLYRAASEGTAPGFPAVQMSDLGLTANQVIEEMEELDQVPDRALLARLCLVREEIRDFELQASWTSPSGGDADAVTSRWYRSSVPTRTMGFVNELVRVNARPQRSQLLYRTFTEDWQGGKAALKKKEQALKAGKNIQGDDNPNLDIVRPGKFMTALMATTTELSKSPGTPEALLNRLRDIKEEAMLVLQEVSTR